MLRITKINNTYMRIDCDDDICLELNQYFAVFSEGYKFHPLFKQRRWDGKIRFFNASRKTLPLGLILELVHFCSERRYEIHLSREIKESFDDKTYSKEKFAEEFLKIPMNAYGEKIELRDYQLLGIYEAIKNKRKLFSSNTSSGKSAIQYGIIRLLLDRVPNKILLIVPATSLVEQMYSDFKDYSSEDEGFYVEDYCARLYAEYRYDNSKQVLISTWQSLQGRIKDDPEFFQQFDAVLTDEAHQAKAAVISKIMELCINAEYRLAFTGTVPKEVSNKMTITGHFGPVKVLQTSKQAMDKGYVSKLSITGLILKYDKETSKRISKLKYQDEMEELCKLQARNELITKTALNLRGNTLILTARVESHGKVLYEMLKTKEGIKKIFYIFGEVPVEERERIRQLLEKEDNIIIVGNYQILSTGWSARRLNNIMFAFPSKSFTRVVQSIGRSLRKHESKEEEGAQIYDIVDNCNEKNYAWNHFLERLKIYAEEEFEFKLVELDINANTSDDKGYFR